MQTKVIKSNKEKIREMTMLAIFIAIIAVLGLVPSFGLGSSSLGFIRIAPNIEATIIHIPVLIGGTLLGRKMSIYLGLAFGVVSLIAAFIYNSPMFVYPWVSVLPRILFGLVIYDVMRLFQHIFKNKYLAFGLGFFVLTLIHTFMVLPLLWTSFTTVFGYASLGQAFLPYLAFLVFYLVPVAALIEAFLAGLIGSVVALRLKGYLENRTEDPAEI
ncbi:MAG TPA: hypothetical protein DCR44_05105 [Acholeplasmatales bacterium]|nr:hypothetical protein [Acholeplasmatales bacterium]